MEGSVHDCHGPGKGALVLHNSRPPVAADANRHTDVAPTACAAATIAVTASPTAVPAGSIPASDGSAHNAHRVEVGADACSTLDQP